MKSKAMNRPMFLDVENVGIMQGFKDEDGGGEYDTGAMLERTPSSPEILMNNLRGDMRSIDARMEELAQLVGEEAAMDTPAEVLALLQPVLASQEGIGSLPAGMPDQPMGSPTPPPSPMGNAMPASDMGMMPPDMGMMPPDMGMMPQDMMPVDVPPGPPPTAQAPLNMAEGGFVQRFREGSDEEGVTPMSVKSPPRAGSAQALLAELAATRDPEALGRNFEQLLPLYQQALGGEDRSMTQAQILFDISQAGLNLAAGTDSQGKRVRPGASFASSLAAAAQGVPERIASRVGQMEQQEQGVRLAALKGAQEQATGQRALEQGVITDFARSDRDMEQKVQLANMEYGRQLQLARLKADLDRENKLIELGLKPAEFKTNWEEQTVVELTPGYAEGTLTPAEDRRYEAAAVNLAKGNTIQTTDDKNRPITITTPGKEYSFMIDALRKRGTLDTVLKKALPIIPQAIQDEIKAAGGDASKLSQATVDFLKQNVSPVVESGIDPTASSNNTIWASHKNAIGIFRQLGVLFGGRVPFDFAGTFSTGVKQNTKNIEMLRTNFAQAFRETKKLADAERQEINQFLDLQPRFFQNEVDYRNNLISLTTTLDALSRKFNTVANDPKASLELKNLNEDKMAEIKGLQQLLGAPMVIRTQADLAKLAQLPIGTEVLLYDSKNQRFVLDSVKPRQ